jgi:hypothetical protein
MQTKTPIRVKRKKPQFLVDDYGLTGLVKLRFLLQVGPECFRLSTSCPVFGEVDSGSNEVVWKRKGKRAVDDDDEIESLGTSMHVDETQYPDPEPFENATGCLGFGDDEEEYKAVESRMVAEWDSLVCELRKLDHEIIRVVLIGREDADFTRLRKQRQEAYERCKAARELVVARINRAMDRAVSRWDIETRHSTWRTRR